MYLKKVLLFVLSCLGAVTCLGQKVEGGRRNLIVGEETPMLVRMNSTFKLFILYDEVIQIVLIRTPLSSTLILARLHSIQGF
mmetsp:Transcript_5655/g.7424  ORF Transcript_5655/g.7424 Transcript_5655/m.7424 type:complete len:82 (+) Transcript_5655:46-291(+)